MMSFKKPVITPLFISALILKAAVCFVLAVAIILYWFKVRNVYGVTSNFWVLGFLLIPGIAVPLAIFKKVYNENFRRQSLLVFVAESLFTSPILYAVFSGPMHDIMLEYFGYHGYFSAENLDNGPSYILNKFILTLIITLTPLITGIVYYISKQQKLSR